MQNQISTITNQLNHFDFLGSSTNDRIYMYQAKYSGTEYGTTVTFSSSINYQTLNMLIFTRHGLHGLIAERSNVVGYTITSTLLNGKSYITVSISDDNVIIKTARYERFSILFAKNLDDLTITEIKNTQ